MPTTRATRPTTFPSPLAKKQDALKQKAREMVFKGQATAKGKNQVVKVATRASTSSWPSRVRTRSSRCSASSANPRTTPTPARPVQPRGTPGPQHNQIPRAEPGDVDNTTIWTQGLQPGLLPEPALQQGPGSLDGELVPPSVVGPLQRQRLRRATGCRCRNNEAAYGSNYCGNITCTRDTALPRVDQSTPGVADDDRPR